MIEQDELLGERVGVGRYTAPVLHQRAVARTFADVAEDLVVGAVFAHDVDDMVDQRSLAGTLGNRARRDVATRHE